MNKRRRKERLSVDSLWASQVALVAKHPPASAGDIRDVGWKSSWSRHGHPLQCSCLDHPTDRGAWRAAVHGSQSRTWLKQVSMHAGRQPLALSYPRKITLLSPPPDPVNCISKKGPPWGKGKWTQFNVRTKDNYQTVFPFLLRNHFWSIY